jgi:hypothetical protein
VEGIHDFNLDDALEETSQCISLEFVALAMKNLWMESTRRCTLLIQYTILEKP